MIRMFDFVQYIPAFVFGLFFGSLLTVFSIVRVRINVGGVL